MHATSEEESMSKKAIVIIALAITATLLFAACERSASQPVLATPTAEGSTALPTGISLVQAWGTSTAVYLQTAQAQGLISPTPSPTLGPNQVPPTGVATATLVPGTTPVVIAPTTTPGRPATYTLQSGEFPYCIARRFDVNPGDLLALNGLGSSGQGLQPGLQLRIPSTGSFPDVRALHAHPTQYTVAVDDTIYKIACYFGDIDPTSIAAANGLALSSPLTTGRILNIP
jgi:LysM repeat protein